MVLHVSDAAAALGKSWIEADGLTTSHAQQGMCLLQRTAAATDRPPPEQDFSLVDSLRPHRRCHAKVVVDVGLPRTGTYNFGLFMSELGFTSYHHNATRWHLPNYHDYRSLFNDVPPNGMALSDDPWAEDGCMIRKTQPAAMEGQVKYVLMHRDNATAWRLSLKRLACEYWAFRDYEMLLSFCSGERWMVTGWRQLTILPQLGQRWCQAARKHGVQKFCSTELQSTREVAIETKMAEHYLEDHVKKMRGCIPSQDLLEVHLHGAELEARLFEFLGCRGPVPPWPDTNASTHA